MPSPKPAKEIEPTLVELKLNESRILSDDEGRAAELTSYIVETIEANPDDPESYPAGSGVTMTVKVGAYEVHLSELSRGYEGTPVAWTPEHRVTLHGHSSRTPSVEVQIERISTTLDRVVHDGERVERGKRLTLAPELEAEFVAHGHKRTYPGQQSPLIVSMRYLQNDQVLEDASYNLFPPDDRSWTWRNYSFTLESHGYDEFMVLSVGALALVPLHAKQSEAD